MTILFYTVCATVLVNRLECSSVTMAGTPTGPAASAAGLAPTSSPWPWRPSPCRPPSRKPAAAGRSCCAGSLRSTRCGVPAAHTRYASSPSLPSPERSTGFSATCAASLRSPAARAPPAQEVSPHRHLGVSRSPPPPDPWVRGRAAGVRTCRLVALAVSDPAVPDPGRATGCGRRSTPGSDRKQRVDHPIRLPGQSTHPALL